MSGLITIMAQGGGDPTPDQFNFTSCTGQELSTVRVSNSVTPAGFTSPAPVNITGGAFCIQGSGTWCTGTACIDFGESIQVCATSSSSYNTTDTIKLCLGPTYNFTTNCWCLNTRVKDETPSGTLCVCCFTTDLLPNTQCTYSFVPTGFDCAQISVSTDAGATTPACINVNNVGYGTSACCVCSGQTVCVATPTEDDFNTTRNYCISIGTISNCTGCITTCQAPGFQLLATSTKGRNCMTMFEVCTCCQLKNRSVSQYYDYNYPGHFGSCEVAALYCIGTTSRCTFYTCDGNVTDSSISHGSQCGCPCRWIRYPAVSQCVCYCTWTSFSSNKTFSVRKNNWGCGVSCYSNQVCVADGPGTVATDNLGNTYTAYVNSECFLRLYKMCPDGTNYTLFCYSCACRNSDKVIYSCAWNCNNCNNLTMIHAVDGPNTGGSLVFTAIDRCVSGTGSAGFKLCCVNGSGIRDTSNNCTNAFVICNLGDGCLNGCAVPCICFQGDYFSGSYYSTHCFMASFNNGHLSVNLARCASGCCCAGCRILVIYCGTQICACNCLVCMGSGYPCGRVYSWHDHDTGALNLLGIHTGNCCVVHWTAWKKGYPCNNLWCCVGDTAGKSNINSFMSSWCCNPDWFHFPGHFVYLGTN